MSTATTLTIADRIEDLDWPALTARMDERRFRPDAARAQRVGVPQPGLELRGRALPLDHRHAPLSLRRGPVQVLRRAAARAHRRRAPRALPAARRPGQRLGAAPGGARRPTRPSSTTSSSAATAPGQRRTTPLILRYGEGGHNTLHQDVYGEVAFPLQVVTMLDRPGEDFEGGQFVLLEQRPRAQSRAHVIDLRARRLPDLPHPPPPGAGHPRLLPRDDAPRRGDGALGPAHDARGHLPRRRLTGLANFASMPSSRQLEPALEAPLVEAIRPRSSSLAARRAVGLHARVQMWGTRRSRSGCGGGRRPPPSTRRRCPRRAPRTRRRVGAHDEADDVVVDERR